MGGGGGGEGKSYNSDFTPKGALLFFDHNK